MKEVLFVNGEPNLKACPFCGSKVDVSSEPDEWIPTYNDPDSGGRPYTIQCKCGVKFGIGCHELPELIQAWNKRSLDIEPVSEDRRVTLTDFVANQTAYTVGSYSGGHLETEMRTVQVKKVDCKYVTLVSGRKYCVNYRKFSTCLVEDVAFAQPKLLFSAKEDAERYIEHNKLAAWLRKVSTDGKDYTVEQLRIVKEILERRL